MTDYSSAIRKGFKAKYRRLVKKDGLRRQRVIKKIKEIVLNPHAYKPLRNVMRGLRAVHIDPYVLIFSIDEKNKIIWFEDFEHHDRVYKTKK
jgi:YafQ family addiction module toxin component